MRFELLWPDPQADAARNAKANAHSCVLRVSSAYHAVLLPGDVEAAQERALLAAARPLHATVLLAPHHGSATSSSDAFIDAVRPREVVFQAGYRNRFHHPHPDVVRRYRLRGVRLARSDADGAVVFESDGKTLRVTRDRALRRRYWMQR